MERSQSIHHNDHSHKRENASRDTTNTITKVQETDGERSEKDCKVEPREEGTLVGEKDFGFDADGEGDALSGGRLEEGLGCRWCWHGCGVDVFCP